MSCETYLPSKNTSRFTLNLFALIAIAFTYSAGAQNLQRIEELTITATRQDRTIQNVAGTISLVTIENIEKEMVDDLDDVVRYQPGVSMGNNSRGGNQGFTIRGIGGNRVLHVIDGVRSSDIYYGNGKDTFEMDNLQGIQIIRGPASVLYGADAMGGAVVFQTKTSRDYVGSDSGTYFGARTSASDADDQIKAGATTAFQNGSFGLIAQITQRDFSEHEVNGTGSVNPHDGETQGGLIKAFWDISANQSLAISFESFEENRDFNLLTDLLGRNAGTVFSSLGFDESERTRTGLEYNLLRSSGIFDDLQLLVNLQSTDSTQRTVQERTSFSFVNPRNPRSFAGTAAIRDTTFGFEQETLALNLNLRKSIETESLTHNFAYGFNFDETETSRPRDRFDTETSSGSISRSISAYPMAPAEVFPNKSFPDTTTTRLGFYLQDEVQVGNTGLSLIPGVRYDRYELAATIDSLLDGTNTVEGYGYPVRDFDDGEFSLSLGAIYDIDESYSLFAQYAEGYRPPNFNESNQAFANLAYRYAVVPNPDIRAETSKSFEFGLRADYENAYLSVSAFRNSYKDFISSNFIGRSGAVSLYQNQNIDDVEIHGAEATAFLYFGENWRMRSAIAYAMGRDQETSQHLDSVDPVNLVNSLRYDSTSGSWGAELFWTVVADKTKVSSDSVTGADGYQVLDAVVDLRIGDSLSVRAGVFNIFDEEYARWQSIQGLNKVTAADTILNNYQPGTNLRLGINANF